MATRSSAPNTLSWTPGMPPASLEIMSPPKAGTTSARAGFERHTDRKYGPRSERAWTLTSVSSVLTVQGSVCLQKKKESSFFLLKQNDASLKDWFLNNTVKAVVGTSRVDPGCPTGKTLSLEFSRCYMFRRHILALSLHGGTLVSKQSEIKCKTTN